jgi:hypothetical protein
MSTLYGQKPRAEPKRRQAGSEIEARDIAMLIRLPAADLAFAACIG